MKGIGIPEVVIVLGLLIVLIAGFLPSGNPLGQKETILLSKEGGTLGTEGRDYHHIPLADNLVLSKGVNGMPLLSQKGPIEIAKGVITTQEQESEFVIPEATKNDLSSAILSLDISDTNSYGPLKIYLNDELIWSEFSSRNDELHIVLPIEKLSEKNVIKISAGSSGWKIWSPTYYIIESMEVREKLTSGDEKTISFTVPKDLVEKFDLGRIYIGNVNPIIEGELAIILNDERIIFRGMPGRGSVINSFSSGIKENNTVTFRLLEDGHYELSNIEVIIFTETNSTGGFSSSFVIPVEELSKMMSGTVEGVVEIDVLNTAENKLEVILSSETDHELYNAIPNKGKIQLSFSGIEAARDNTLIIRSASKYELGLVTVKLVER